MYRHLLPESSFEGQLPSPNVQRPVLLLMHNQAFTHLVGSVT
jgi:hypothetical protein